MNINLLEKSIFFENVARRPTLVVVARPVHHLTLPENGQAKGAVTLHPSKHHQLLVVGGHVQSEVLRPDPSSRLQDFNGA